ncbi:hypothetical protein [Bordetella sp. FB-8]|uniref:hypothetical protein n=1 Tax=Bordetella sp. FB-8 TaxID=1159870 RepID=UPI0009DB24F3|nr:hypothetical protein [Bordetella sp. FB-8]
MANGSITLGAVATRASHIEVACSRCERLGRYRLSKRVASFGENSPMTALGAQITDCSKKNRPLRERCDVYYPGLSAIMSGDELASSDFM